METRRFIIPVGMEIESNDEEVESLSVHPDSKYILAQCGKAIII
jgi:hypothetical protein